MFRTTNSLLRLGCNNRMPWITTRIGANLHPVVAGRARETRLPAAATAKTQRAYSSSARVGSPEESETPPNSGAGAGVGNVKDKVFPSASDDGENLFRYCKHPRTVSIIG